MQKNGIHELREVSWHALVITPAAIGGAVDISLEEWDHLSDSSG